MYPGSFLLEKRWRTTARLRWRASVSRARSILSSLAELIFPPFADIEAEDYINFSEL